jgi:hypothetical protein
MPGLRTAPQGNGSNVTSLGVSKNARIAVRLRDKTRVSGYISFGFARGTITISSER